MQQKDQESLYDVELQIKQRLLSLKSRIEDIVVTMKLPGVGEELAGSETLYHIDNVILGIDKIIDEQFGGDSEAFMQYFTEIEALKNVLSNLQVRKKLEKLQVVIEELNGAVALAAGSEWFKELAYWASNSEKKLRNIEHMRSRMTGPKGQEFMELVDAQVQKVIETTVSAVSEKMIGESGQKPSQIDAWIALFLYKAVLLKDATPLSTALLKALSS